MFAKISGAKIREGIFVEPQIRKLMSVPAFEYILNKVEFVLRISFTKVANNFLRNHKTRNYREL